MKTKCSHFMLIIISGMMWVVIGVMLMSMGMRHLIEGLRFWDELGSLSHFSLFKYFTYVTPKSQIALGFVIGVCLLVGYLKGQYVLSKAVKKGVQRIVASPNPSELKNLYDKRYYGIIFLMMMLGMTLRMLKLPHDLHGAIDMTIGAALIKGALTYFKYAFLEKKGDLAQEKW